MRIELSAYNKEVNALAKEHTETNFCGKPEGGCWAYALNQAGGSWKVSA